MSCPTTAHDDLDGARAQKHLAPKPETILFLSSCKLGYSSQGNTCAHQRKCLNLINNIETKNFSPYYFMAITMQTL